VRSQLGKRDGVNGSGLVTLEEFVGCLVITERNMPGVPVPLGKRGMGELDAICYVEEFVCGFAGSNGDQAGVPCANWKAWMIEGERIG